MIQPHELVYGAIFEYNLGDKDFPKWELRTLNLDNIRECIECNDFHSYRSITLTEKILTEWCGFHKVEENQYRLGFKLIVIRDGKFFDYGSSVELPYLHIFQRLILALTNQPLKIELK